MPRQTLYLAADTTADALLAKDPLALLIGMVLDQQVPMERAFGAPALLAERLGGLDAGAIAAADPEKLKATFSAPPALHRFPGSMAARVQAVCQVLVDDYGGDAAGIWRDAGDGATLRKRLEALPGFGAQKARIFLALLGKQLKVTPPGWREASAPYGEDGAFRSVADIVDADSLARVRATKAEAKATAKAKVAGTKAAGAKPAGTKPAGAKPAKAARAKTGR